MAKVAAIGAGPVVFFDDGKQIEVPLSEIHFDNSEVGTTRTNLPPGFDKWLKFLASQGRLVASAAPPAPKSILITAAVPGISGNDIQFTVEPKSLRDVIPVTVDVTVTETDQYRGLTLEALVSTLGIDGEDSGITPGLLTFSSSCPSAAVLRTLEVEEDQDISMTAGGAGDPPTWTIAGATTTTPVKLQPRRPDPRFDRADLMTLSITDASEPSVGATFTLTFTWTRIFEDVTVADFADTQASTILADLDYLVKVSPPDRDTPITNPPRPGTVVLLGGSELVKARPATATVMAKQ